MDTRTILIENWGFSPEEVSSKQFQIKKLGEISNEYIEEKAKFYENEYGISHDEFLKIIHVFPSTISLSQQYVLGKFEFYKKTFGFTKQSFKKMIKNGANAISYSEENILDKFHNLQKQFGISASEYGRMIVATPSLIGISYDMFKERETLYIEHFGLTRDEFKKLLLHDAFIFRPANETILQKEEFFRKNFGFKKNDFVKLLKQNPCLLCYSEDSILQKANFIANEFNLSKDQACDAIKNWSTILSLSPESLHAKNKILQEIGIDPSFVCYDPKIVSAPEKSLKARYIIARSVATDEELFSKKAWYMTNQNKVFARLQYLKSIKHKVKIGDLYQEEKQFEQYYGIDSESLIKVYRLDSENLQNLLEQFNLHSDKKIKLSKAELDYINENQESEKE